MKGIFTTPIPVFWTWVIGAGLVGWILGAICHWLPVQSPDQIDPIRMPALWRIPQLPGMGSLRLAMVNDVLHERFAIRSAGWYTARNRIASSQIADWSATGSAPTPKILEAFDDLAVGLDRLGEDGAAEAVLLRKAMMLHLELPRQRSISQEDLEPDSAPAHDLKMVRERGVLSESDQQRYTTYANLGTILVHGHMAGALAGQASAVEQVQQGLCCLDLAVAINPAAHFGRERWQIAAIEHFLTCRTQPALLLQFDCIGDELPMDASPGSPYPHGGVSVAEWPRMIAPDALPSDPSALLRITRSSNRLFADDWSADYVDQHLSDRRRLELRSHLCMVGASEGWVAAVHPSRGTAAAFDEPLLGLLGLWSWGGGANPHLALAIATICEKIGQRPLAVDAYERCIAMAQKFNPDPTIQQRLIEHCHMRESLLASALAPADPRKWLEAEQRRSATELNWALDRRRAAERVEAKALAAGVDPAAIPLGDGDPAPLASSPGTSDEHWGVLSSRMPLGDGTACALLAMAATSWLAIGISAWRRRHPALAVDH